MPLTPGTKFGPYEILSPLGAGGMGEVYRAKDSRLGREVAIKVLPAGFAVDGERLKRFELEAKATSALNHPNILTVYDIGTHEGAPYLVAELLEGQTLRDKLTGPLPPKKAVEWAIQMAHGLVAAHEKGIVHRDLKPENLFITKDNRLKILDFGLAKLIEPVQSQQENNETPTRTVNTSAGVVMGTAGYMSPEQVRGEPIDLRSDLFAFGVILYEMISGQRAFKKNSVVETMNAILTEEPPEFPPLEPALPPGLDRLVRHCLEKLPVARFQSARDMAFNLESLSGISGVGIKAITAPAPPARQVIRAAILPPENTKFELEDAYAASLVISPDGRKLVFTAETQDKKKPLWVRSLDSMTAQPLAGTEDGMYPFWSPDSRFIGFISKSKLKKIDSTGGPVVTLCDAPAGYAGTWGADNMILFIPKLFGPIHQVSAAGGTSLPVALPDGAQVHDAHHWPVFLPDGRHYLYLRFGGSETGFAIYMASLDGVTNRFLVESDSNAAYAGGYLLYQRGRVLMARPFDLLTREVTGEPTPVAEPVRKVGNRLLTAFSASQSGVLVYQADSANRDDDSQLTWTDRTGKHLGKMGKPAIHEYIRISPDGKRIAATIREPDKRATDLWVYEVARGLKTRLTSNVGYIHAPVWSPDCKRIVFASMRGNRHELHEVFADGSGKSTRLAESKLMLFPCDWSPDGQLLVYGERIDRSAEKWNFLSLPRGGESQPLPCLQEGLPVPPMEFSDDGKWIAYESNLSGSGDIYVTPFPGPGGKILIATEGCSHPSHPLWRRDMKALIYIQNEQLMETEILLQGDELEAGESRILFSDGVKNTRGIDASADGERFLMALSMETVSPSSQFAAPSPIILVVNWDADLKS